MDVITAEGLVKIYKSRKSEIRLGARRDRSMSR